MLIALACLSLDGCGRTMTPAQAHLAAACIAYKETGRVQVATTVEQASAMTDVAVAEARAAAAFDSRLRNLSADVQTALHLQQALQNASEAQSNRYFRADGRVQEDCRAAGHDIGDLKP